MSEYSCDWCAEEVGDGAGIYLNDDADRVCGECAEKKRHCRECDLDVPELYSVGLGRFWCEKCTHADNEKMRVRDDMSPFERWLHEGYTAGWVGPPICQTHDGTPTSAEEDEDWETGDPCLHILRLYADADEKAGVEANHSPSVWRATNRWG